MIKRIHKIAVAITLVSASLAIHAATTTVDFETDTIGSGKANGFASFPTPGLTFYDSMNAPGLRVTASSATYPVPSIPMGTKALAVDAADSSALLMSWDPTYYPLGIDTVSLNFSNDRGTNNFARLMLFNGVTALQYLAASPGTYTPVATVFATGDGVGGTAESIAYNGPFDFSMAIFVEGFETIAGDGSTFAPGGNREVVDNIVFTDNVAPNETPVPEVQTYATMLGAALIGLRALARRRRA